MRKKDHIKDSSWIIFLRSRIGRLKRGGHGFTHGRSRLIGWGVYPSISRKRYLSGADLMTLQWPGYQSISLNPLLLFKARICFLESGMNHSSRQFYGEGESNHHLVSIDIGIWTRGSSMLLWWGNFGQKWTESVHLFRSQHRTGVDLYQWTSIQPDWLVSRSPQSHAYSGQSIRLFVLGATHVNLEYRLVVATTRSIPHR